MEYACLVRSCSAIYTCRTYSTHRWRFPQADAATVLRNGRLSVLPASELVPGDIVEVSGKVLISDLLHRGGTQRDGRLTIVQVSAFVTHGSQFG